MSNLAVVTNTELEPTELQLSTDWYEVMKDKVGGYVEMVRLNPMVTMWVNEEGLIHNLPINPVGTIAYAVAFDCLENPHPIAGTIVFTGGITAEGEPTGLTNEGLDWLAMVGMLGMLMSRKRGE
jgi:hypothetical protein